VLSSVIKAKSAVIEGRIIKLQLTDSYFYFYIFMGKYRDYILNEILCSCKNFLFNNIFKNNNKCYHQYALEYALEMDKVLTLEVTEDLMRDIIMEIYTMDKSFILRKILFSRGLIR